jgi:lipopolysaccharide export system protein LptC
MKSLPRLTSSTPASIWLKHLEAVVAWLPMILLLSMLWVSAWLVRNAPTALSAGLMRASSHEPDYFAHSFTLKVYSLEGQLKSLLQGESSVHYPDTLINLVEQPVVYAVARSGRLTTAVANRSLSNEDGSEIQLIGQAVVHKEGLATLEPSMTLRSEFIHLFANTDRVVTYAPVKIERGQNSFTANSLKADNLNQFFQLQGRVKAVLVPQKRL